MDWRDSNGQIKARRGKRIACRIVNTDTRATVLIKAERKWRQHHPDIYDENEEYRLLYESGVEVKTIPGSDESFVLHKYKEEIGKDYKRIVLYLCKKSDIDAAAIFNTYSSCSDDESSSKLPKLEDDLCPYFTSNLSDIELFPGIVNAHENQPVPSMSSSLPSIANVLENQSLQTHSLQSSSLLSSTKTTANISGAADSTGMYSLIIIQSCTFEVSPCVTKLHLNNCHYLNFSVTTIWCLLN